MQRSKTFQFLTESLIWLAGSLILALIVWIAASIEQNPVEVRSFPQRIPIEIVTDEGMIVTNNPTANAQAVLRAQSAVWETLERQDILVQADLRGYDPGTYTVDLNTSFNSTQRIVLEDLQPNQVTVTIDRASEKLVPVQERILSDPPTGYEIVEISFGTPQVQVTGPASQVEQIVAVDARLGLNDERNPVTREIRLTAVDGEGRTVSGVTLEPETITVSVNIQQREDFLEVFVTPNIIGEPASGYVIYGITYEPQTILVSGRPNDLEQLPGAILTTPIDLTGQTTTFSQTVSVQLPAGVFLPTEQNITVTVELDTLTASRRFEFLPVQVQGLSPDLQAEITPTEVTLLITGPQPVLETLLPEDITILADLTDLGVGNHQVPLEAIINREGLETANTSVLPSRLEVQISAGEAGEATPTVPATPAPGIIIPPSVSPPTPTAEATNAG